MPSKHMVIVGGGLAGLSAGCYARASGFETTIVEHAASLGGVCTAWRRGEYLVDGCIHWLTGGPFDRVYRELGILPKLSVHVLQSFASYRDVTRRERVDIDVVRDLAALRTQLVTLAPEDLEEIDRLIAAAEGFVEVAPPLDAPELGSLHDSLLAAWQLRHQVGALVHFRKPVGVWAREHLQNPDLRRFFLRFMLPEAPAFFLLMVLGYLSRGYLSRPDGGTARFRDTLIAQYRAAGGHEVLGANVEEILVKDDRACGVLLADGRVIDADVVVSTASTPETVLRLLGGRYDADPLRALLATWKLFDPLVLASFGVATPLKDAPATLIIDGIEPFALGRKQNEHLYLRIYNDDPSFAPEGHTVVQVMASTDYDSWAHAGPEYAARKAQAAELLQRQIEQHLPIAGKVRMVDVATPLTFYRQARSYRGAFEGYLPTANAFTSHVRKTLKGLDGLFMAGQWVEPGGGVPTALTSGRQAVQLACAANGCRFQPPVPA